MAAAACTHRGGGGRPRRPQAAGAERTYYYVRAITNARAHTQRTRNARARLHLRAHARTSCNTAAPPEGAHRRRWLQMAAHSSALASMADCRAAEFSTLRASRRTSGGDQNTRRRRERQRLKSGRELRKSGENVWRLRKIAYIRGE